MRLARMTLRCAEPGEVEGMEQRQQPEDQIRSASEVPLGGLVEAVHEFACSKPAL